MKKNFQKILRSLSKNKKHNKIGKKSKFLFYKEDFVITSQEEKEGGFFRSYHFKATTT